MKDPSALTIELARKTMAETPHFSIRRVKGLPYEFCCGIDARAVVTREDARRLLNLGHIRMERLTELDGWQYVPSDVGQYKHLGERLAAVATFDNIHRNPATRHRYGDYAPPPVIIDDSVVVSVWQDPGKSIETTAHPRKKKAT